MYLYFIYIYFIYFLHARRVFLLQDNYFVKDNSVSDLHVRTLSWSVQLGDKLKVDLCDYRDDNEYVDDDGGDNDDDNTDEEYVDLMVMVVM